MIGKRKPKSLDRVGKQLNSKIKMKTLELSAHGVEEMNEAQMSEVDGGILITLGTAATIWAIQAGICTALVAVYVAYDTVGKLNK